MRKSRKIDSKTMPIIFGAVINMGGLAHKNILTLKFSSNDSSGEDWVYVDKKNDDCIGYGKKKEFLGLNKKDGYWLFLSDDRKEVELFQQGALAACEFMSKQWFKYYLDK